MSRKESFMMSYYKVKKNPGVEDRKFQKDVNMKTSFYDSFLLPLSIPSNQSASHFQGLKQGMARKMTVSREKNLFCLAQQTEMSWCYYITNTLSSIYNTLSSLIFSIVLRIILLSFQIDFDAHWRNCRFKLESNSWLILLLILFLDGGSMILRRSR